MLKIHIRFEKDAAYYYVNSIWLIAIVKEGETYKLTQNDNTESTYPSMEEADAEARRMIIRFFNSQGVKTNFIIENPSK